MNRKKKGITAERELVHLFWHNGWAAIRVAGSGNTQFPSVDLLAGKPGRLCAIECKAIKGDVKYFDEEEIAQLQTFSRIFGAEAWIGMRFNHMPWYFLMIEDLIKNKAMYKIDKKLLETKGVEFEKMLHS